MFALDCCSCCAGVECLIYGCGPEDVIDVMLVTRAIES